MNAKILRRRIWKIRIFLLLLSSRLVSSSPQSHSPPAIHYILFILLCHSKQTQLSRCIFTVNVIYSTVDKGVEYLRSSGKVAYFRFSEWKYMYLRRRRAWQIIKEEKTGDRRNFLLFNAAISLHWKHSSRSIVTFSRWSVIDFQMSATCTSKKNFIFYLPMGLRKRVGFLNFAPLPKLRIRVLRENFVKITAEIIRKFCGLIVRLSEFGYFGCSGSTINISATAKNWELRIFTKCSDNSVFKRSNILHPKTAYTSRLLPTMSNDVSTSKCAFGNNPQYLIVYIPLNVRLFRRQIHVEMLA